MWPEGLESSSTCTGHAADADHPLQPRVLHPDLKITLDVPNPTSSKLRKPEFENKAPRRNSGIFSWATGLELGCKGARIRVWVRFWVLDWSI